MSLRRRVERLEVALPALPDPYRAWLAALSDDGLYTELARVKGCTVEEIRARPPAEQRASILRLRQELGIPRDQRL